MWSVVCWAQFPSFGPGVGTSLHIVMFYTLCSYTPTSTPKGMLIRYLFTPGPRLEPRYRWSIIFICFLIHVILINCFFKGSLYLFSFVVSEVVCSLSDRSRLHARSCDTSAAAATGNLTLQRCPLVAAPCTVQLCYSQELISAGIRKYAK